MKYQARHLKNNNDGHVTKVIATVGLGMALGGAVQVSAHQFNLHSDLLTSVQAAEITPATQTSTGRQANKQAVSTPAPTSSAVSNQATQASSSAPVSSAVSSAAPAQTTPSSAATSSSVANAAAKVPDKAQVNKQAKSDYDPAVTYVQFGVLNQDMKDSTGYIYKAGTKVARGTKYAGQYGDEFSMNLSINSGFPIGFGYGSVDPQYVTITNVEKYDNLTAEGQWVLKNYMTNEGLYETLTPASDTPVTPAVDKSNLQSAINKANSALKNASQYTDASVANLKFVLGNANAVYGNADATQAQVDDATNKLNAAINGLTKKPSTPDTPSVDKDALQNAVNQANATLKDADQYTDASVALVKTALTAGQKALSNAKATQAQVDSATTAIKNALSHLVKKDNTKPSQGIDKSQLLDAVNQANDKLKNTGNYTDDSIKKLESVVNDAKVFLADGAGTQADVDQATKDVLAAIEALKSKTVNPSNDGSDNSNATDNSKTNSNNNGSKSTDVKSNSNQTKNGNDNYIPRAGNKNNGKQAPYKPRHAASNALPQTGEATNNGMILVGLSTLISTLGLGFLVKKRMD